MTIGIQKPQAKAITELSKSASKDPTRFDLTHVQIMRADTFNTIKCTVTDGHKMVQIIIEEESLYTLADKPIYLSPEQIKRLETEIKLAGRTPLVLIDDFKFTQDINYPNTKQFISDYKGHKGCLYGINLDLINDVRVSLKACAGKAASCKVYSKDARSPVVFELVSRQDWCKEALAVVMPMRL